MDRTSVLPEVLKRRPNKLEENLLGRVVDCYSQAWWGSQETSAPAGAEEGTRDAEEGTRDAEEGTRGAEEGTRDAEEGERDAEKGTRVVVERYR
jgi:hypothetical protein